MSQHYGYPTVNSSVSFLVGKIDGATRRFSVVKRGRKDCRRVTHSGHQPVSFYCHLVPPSPSWYRVPWGQPEDRPHVSPVSTPSLAAVVMSACWWIYLVTMHEPMWISSGCGKYWFQVRLKSVLFQINFGCQINILPSHSLSTVTATVNVTISTTSSLQSRKEPKRRRIGSRGSLRFVAS
jgi:hypothetical protein